MSNTGKKNKMQQFQQKKSPNILENNLKKEKNTNDSNKNNHKKDDNLNNNHRNDKKGHQLQDTLTEKVFVARNSLLTDLFETPHIRTIYHILVVALILLFLNTLIYDILDTGRINIGGSLIIIGFGKFDVVLLTWICMQLVAFIPYLFFGAWANTRSRLSTKSKTLKIFDRIWLCLFVGFQLAFITFFTIIIVRCKLPMASALTAITEMLRFVMKVHAYVRTVAPRVLEKQSNKSLPEISKYVYFMFAPTLLYRDSYPRNDHIRWNKVIAYLFEFATVIYFTSFLIERYLLVNWSSFGDNAKVLELKEFIQMIFHSMLPGTLFYLSGFYLLLHCWLNATAELLTFADRRFYMDWWTQSRYSSFYRTWNMVVHDWLYTFFYKEFIIMTGKRSVATLSVFIISALIHEFILTVAFGFFYPILLILFGVFGVLFIFATRHANYTIGNIAIWLPLFIGNGILWVGYSMEYFARINCPQIIENDFYDLLVPRSWFCDHIIYT